MCLIVVAFGAAARYPLLIAANRDEIIILRKMSEINWFDKAADDSELAATGTADWGGTRKEGERKETST